MCVLEIAPRPAAWLLSHVKLMWLNVAYFHRGEHHVLPWGIIRFHVLVIGILTVVRIQFYGQTAHSVLRSNLVLFGLYLIGIYGSTVFYRLFLNPCNKFPGPPLARLSKFQYVFQNALGGFRAHKELQEMHRKYGKVVRIGPYDLSVTDVDAGHVISGSNSKCTKSEWYSNDVPLISMHTTRDKAQHAVRRKVWAPAFSDRVLRGYERRVQKYNDLLIEGLKKRRFGQVVDVTKVFNLYSFDVMGDLAFGRSFDMLESGETHWAIRLLNEGMMPLGLGAPGWLFRLLIGIPGVARDYWKFIHFCCDQLAKRMNEQPERVKQITAGYCGTGGEEKDITYTLIEHFNRMSSEERKEALPLLQGDARLIIVAGSDTTAATLVYLFYWLASNAKMVHELRNEIKKCLGGANFSHQKVVDAELLNGCIYEALRLNPPVPSGIFRTTPKEGVYVGGLYVPGEVNIQMPWYVMGHDEDYYEDAASFRPERWFPGNQEKMVKHKDAWSPFSSGPYGCIGKNLALMEVRSITCQILDVFDITLAPGEDGKKLMEDTVDHFTLGLAPLKIVFTERK